MAHIVFGKAKMKLLPTVKLEFGLTCLSTYLPFEDDPKLMSLKPFLPYKLYKLLDAPMLLTITNIKEI